MRCSDLLRLYSDYRDGFVDDPRREQEIRQHLAGCRRCMNYDASISRGVMLLRATSDIGPSLGFSRRLESRLSQLDGDMEHRDTKRSLHAGIMVVLMMAAAVALAIGIGSEPIDDATQANVVSVTPAPETVSGPTSGGVLVDLTNMSVPAFGTEITGRSRSALSFATWVSLSR
ncbi:MAG: zf-HC2 domain-containing protein [Gemmatimonadota bacterium]|nr:MAG: zf-HC2 domain-containing protein [Gemmatimonadota bacterium]